jgi:hypothetical protein
MSAFCPSSITGTLSRIPHVSHWKTWSAGISFSEGRASLSRISTLHFGQRGTFTRMALALGSLDGPKPSCPRRRPDYGSSGHALIRIHVRLKELPDLQVLCRLLAAICNYLVFDRRTLVESAEARTLDCRNMHEHVFAAALRLDEPVSLRGVEPLHNACRHVSLQMMSSPPVANSTTSGQKKPVGSKYRGRTSNATTPVVGWCHQEGSVYGVQVCGRSVG